MPQDVVIWNDLDGTCNRCGRVWSRYIVPYWEPTRRVCPTCARELFELFERVGWPAFPTENAG